MSVNFINLFFLRLFKRGDVIFLKKNNSLLLEKKKNHKSAEGERLKTVLAVLLISIFISGPWLYASYCSSEIGRLNRSIALLKDKEQSCQQEYNSLKVEYARLTSPVNLNEKMKELGLRFANANEINYLNNSDINKRKMANNFKIH